VQRRSFVFTKIGAAINRARQPVRVRHLRARSHPRGGFPFARCVVTAFACGRFRPSTRQTTIKRAKRNDSLLVFVPSEASERDASCKSAIISIILPCRLITASCHSLAACHCFFLFRPLPSGGGVGGGVRGDPSPPIDVCLKAIWGERIGRIVRDSMRIVLIRTRFASAVSFITQQSKR
jgi:hypothetical protein